MPNYLFGDGDRNVTVSPVGSLVGGFQAGANILNQINRTKLMNEQAEQHKILTAMKLHDDMKGMAYNNLDFYNNAYRPALIKLGVPEGLLPAYDNVDEMNKRLYQNEQMKALYKQKMEGPKVVPPMGSVFSGGNFLYPQSPAFQAQLQQRQTEEQGKFERLKQQFGYNQALKMMGHEFSMKQIQERAEKAPREFAPQLVDLESGEKGVYLPSSGEIKPLKGVVGRTKAGQDPELFLKAQKMLLDAGMLPDNPKYKSSLNEIINNAKGIKTPAQSEKSGWQGPAYYRAPDGSKKAYRTQEEYEKDHGQ